MLVLRTAAVAAAILLVPAIQAGAQNYPERVVKIVNPYPPGGSVDVTGRILAQKLSEITKGQFIVENRTGAGGNIGAEMVAKSDPDGYTLLYAAPGPIAVNQNLYVKGLPFNPEKDFEPIAIFVRTPLVLMVHPTVQAKNVKELIEHAKANPGKINFGSAGMGSTPHLSGELFKSMAKIDLTHVPFRGTGPAMQNLVGGHIQMMFDLFPVALPQISSGKVRALANAGLNRPSALKDVPTVSEQGLAGFDTSSWIALVAPAKTPPAVLAKLRADTAKVIASPDIVKRLTDLGSEAGTADEKEVRAFIANEIKKWAAVIKASGAKVE